MTHGPNILCVHGQLIRSTHGLRYLFKDDLAEQGRPVDKEKAKDKRENLPVSPHYE